MSITEEILGIILIIIMLATGYMAKAEPATRTLIITKPSSTPEVVNQTVTERIIERIVENNNSNNTLRVIGGVMLQDLTKIKSTKTENENGEKETTVTGLPDESELLYGFGYDRRFGVLSIGASYMRNKPRTNEVMTINMGLNW